jgi:hypothetical protein
MERRMKPKLRREKMETSQKISKNYVFALAIASLSLLAALPAAALASDTPVEGTANSSAVEMKGLSNRSANKLGIYLGVGEPAPTLAGVNVAYNVLDYLRLSAGYGKLTVTSGLAYNGNTGELSTQESSITTMGVGARAFVPGWSLTPSAGVHFAHVSYTGNGLAAHGFEESGSHVYSTLGLDWQAKSGFNASLGVAHSFKSDVGNSAYLTIGWFFNWMG